MRHCITIYYAANFPPPRLYAKASEVKLRRKKLTSPVNAASKSVLLCHLANIAQRTGGLLHCDPSNGHILHHEDAMKLWRRAYEKGWEPVV